MTRRLHSQRLADEHAGLTIERNADLRAGPLEEARLRDVLDRGRHQGLRHWIGLVLAMDEARFVPDEDLKRLALYLRLIRDARHPEAQRDHLEAAFNHLDKMLGVDP